MHHLRVGLLGATVLLLALAAAAPYKQGPVFGARFLAQVGSVGVVIGVLPNEYNSLSEQIAERENELQLREEALTRREAALSTNAIREANIVGYSLASTGILFLLILLNFLFDYRARRGIRAGQSVLAQ